MNVGKCPKCGKIVRKVNVEHVEIESAPKGKAWHGASFVCPSADCRTVLGVGVDPLALKADIVAEVKKAMR